MKRHFFILIGPPGVGKGTQAKKLAEAIAMPHISTGDLLRDEIKRETKLGKEAKAVIDAGEFLSDTIILEMLFRRLSAEDCERGALLDGVPRTRGQAEMIGTRLGETDHLHVISLVADDSTVLERIMKRGRSDDTEAVAKRRLELYKEETRPLLEYYSEQGDLQSVDATSDIASIFAQVLLIALKSIKETLPAADGKKTS